MTRGNRDEQKSLMLRAIDLALTFDRPRLLAAHRQFLAKHPQESRERLALRLTNGSAWKAAASGALTGLPSNAFVAVPAAIADTAAMIRIEAYVAARVALLFDENYLASHDLPYELMLPVMGGPLASPSQSESGAHGEASVTRRIIRNVLSKETLRQLKHVMLKYFGAKVTQRALLTKTLPLFGGLIGGTWNYVELRIVGKRSYTYFAARARD